MGTPFRGVALGDAKAKAERIIAGALSRLGWTEGELVGRRKNDPGKMAVAVRLRRETTLSVKRIAAQVHLGTSQTANKRLHQATKAVPPIEPSQEGITHESMDDILRAHPRHLTGPQTYEII